MTKKRTLNKLNVALEESNKGIDELNAKMNESKVKMDRLKRASKRSKSKNGKAGMIQNLINRCLNTYNKKYDMLSDLGYSPKRIVEEMDTLISEMTYKQLKKNITKQIKKGAVTISIEKTSKRDYCIKIEHEGYDIVNPGKKIEHTQNTR